MSRKILLGLTGQTGAGKSTVGAYLRGRGAAVLDGDLAAREVLVGNAELKARLCAAFGDDVYNGDVLDRAALASRAFASPAATATLNSIMHPAVCAWLSARTETAFKTADVVVVDAAALIESGFADRCDLLAVVTAPEPVRLARIMARDGLTEEAARLRMNAQKPESWYVGRADYVIVNDGGPLEEALRPLYAALFGAD